MISYYPLIAQQTERRITLLESHIMADGQVCLVHSLELMSTNYCLVKKTLAPRSMSPFHGRQ